MRLPKVTYYRVYLLFVGLKNVEMHLPPEGTEQFAFYNFNWDADVTNKLSQ